MKDVWRNYNLSIVLTALFLASWALQTWMGWMHFSAEQQAHGQTAQGFGADGYVWDWGEARSRTVERNPPLLSFVVLTCS